MALAAVALALLAPSEQIATRGDLLLAVLVVLTALGIAPHELWDLRTRSTAVLALSLAPFLALVPLAWVLSRLFDSPVREGVLTLGLSSTEVAAVGLVALAGGDAALALGALAGSLIASATLGPLLIGLLAADAASTDTGALLGRFALVEQCWPASDRQHSPCTACATCWPSCPSANANGCARPTGRHSMRPPTNTTPSNDSSP